MTASERWRTRAATLEALVLLVVARTLVARVSFSRWRHTLGSPAAPSTVTAGPLETNRRARRLAAAVSRAARRLPGESRCLPQAMALLWLLRRRGLGGLLHMGARPGDERGGLDDLHAWVTRGGEVLIGARDDLYHPIYVTGHSIP